MRASLNKPYHNKMMWLQQINNTVLGDDAEQSASRRNLRRVFLLRSVIILFLISITLVLWGLHIPVHNDAISLAISAFVFLNAYTLFRLTKAQEVRQFALFWQLVFDIVILAALFYFTGGYSNPFVWMFLLPIAVGAVALQRRNTWILAGVAIVAYSLLVFYHVPLSHLHMHYQEGRDLDIHLVGMWLGFVVSAGIIAFFVTRIGQNLREYDQHIAEAREKILESEHWVSLGTLAASAAHELGTPLSTMNMLADEMQEVLRQDPNRQQEVMDALALITAQIKRCKSILANMAQDAGQLKAESGQRVPLKQFLHSTFQRWMDLRPATLLDISLEGCEQAPQIVADRTLVQTIQNLLDNAADASPNQIACHCECNQGSVTLIVRDYGQGFADDSLQKIGTPLFRAKSSPGMGLGLYLSKTVLARFGGELSFANHPEGGGQVTLYLPFSAILFSADRI